MADAHKEEKSNDWILYNASKPRAEITELRARKYVQKVVSPALESQVANFFSPEECSIWLIVWIQMQHKLLVMAPVNKKSKATRFPIITWAK